MSSTWFRGEEKMKMTFSLGEKETKIDFVLTRNEHSRFLLNVNAIPG